MSGARAVAAILALCCAQGAQAWVRETTVSRQPGQGRWLWWSPRQITFRVNATSASAAPCNDASLAAQQAAQAFPTWAGATRTGEGQACTDFSFVNGGASTSQTVGDRSENLVVFRAGECSDTSLVPVGHACRQTAGACAALFNCWENSLSTIALTTLTYDVNTGEILDADIEMHGWNGKLGGDGRGTYFTCEGSQADSCTNPGFPQLNCKWIEVGTAMTHEAGHVLGLDHVCQYAAPYDPPGSCATESVMVPTFVPGAAPTLALAQDDVLGVCTVYPRGGPTLKPAPAAPEPAAGGCGCGSAEGALGGAAVLLAWALARVRRSRR